MVLFHRRDLEQAHSAKSSRAGRNYWRQAVPQVSCPHIKHEGFIVDSQHIELYPETYRDLLKITKTWCYMDVS